VLRADFLQGNSLGKRQEFWSLRTLNFNNGGVTKLKTAVRYRAA
jgi:hypothetical protein